MHDCPLMATSRLAPASSCLQFTHIFGVCFIIWLWWQKITKTTTCSDYVLDHNMDILFLVETWLSESHNVIIGELCPLGYGFLNVPRPSGDNNGGLGVVIKRDLKLQIIPTDFKSISFEHVIISDSKRDTYFVLIYRPPPSKENGFKIPQLLSEFEEFLIHVNSMSSKQVILGDLNK